MSINAQHWVSSGGTVWTRTKSRRRASGLTEHLLTSENGQTRWVEDLDLQEKYTPRHEV